MDPVFLDVRFRIISDRGKAYLTRTPDFDAKNGARYLIQGGGGQLGGSQMDSRIMNSPMSEFLEARLFYERACPSVTHELTHSLTHRLNISMLIMFLFGAFSVFHPLRQSVTGVNLFTLWLVPQEQSFSQKIQ